MNTPTLNLIMEKRAAARIAKYNSAIMDKPVKELTVGELNKIALQVMTEFYEGNPAPKVCFEAECLRILDVWATQKGYSINQ